MLDRLKFSHKIVLMPALAATAFLLILLVIQLASRYNQQLLDEIESGYAPALELSRDLQEILAEIQRGLQDAVAIDETELLDPVDARATAFLGRLEVGRTIETLDAGELQALERQFRGYYRLGRDLTRRMIADETGVDLARDLEHMRVELNSVQERLATFTNRQRQEMASALRVAQRNQRWSLWGISAITALFLLALVTLSQRVVSSLNRQLGQAVTMADSMAGDEELEMRTFSKDEIGHLLVRMSHMGSRVRERTRQLEHEVGERRRAELALRESEERYALAARGANDGLWDWDLRTGRLYLSPRWRQMLGLDDPQMPEGLEVWRGRIHPEDRGEVDLQLERHRAGLVPHFESEHRIRHRDGSYRWVLARGLAVQDEEGRYYRMAGSLSDITERKRSERQLLHDAFHDGLTGLPNRALFLDRLGQALRVSSRRDDGLFAVLFLDLDRFKMINDSLGHLAGDRLLTLVARRLESCMRPEDTVARLGGDEFAILLDRLDEPSGAVRVAERIQADISQPATIDDHEVRITVSIGVALSSSGYERPEDVLRDADTAMYGAKALGRARHAIFDTAMHARSVALLSLEMDLRRAIDREEFRVLYQPIVSLADGGLRGFEALVRWHHPERGVVLPEEFIGMAEETGLVVPIGELVLDAVAQRLRSWRESFPERQVQVSVNLSPRQLTDARLVGRVAQVIGNGGRQTGGLRFEITETALMGDGDAAVRVLRGLRDLDVRLYVDDFGTGYSSLAYLHRLPIDSLKIDRSFVGRMRPDGSGSEVVKAIVSLAHGLDMDVVAEGVEQAHQASQLRNLGCEEAQGFYFAPPLEPEEAERLLAAGQPFAIDR